MPIDPFFSSSNKKYYIPSPGINEEDVKKEYRRIMDLPFKERQIEITALFQKSRNKTITDFEKIILGKVAFILTRSRRRNIIYKDDKKHQKNLKRWEKAKSQCRTIVIFGGYNTK